MVLLVLSVVVAEILSKYSSTSNSYIENQNVAVIINKYINFNTKELNNVSMIYLVAFHELYHKGIKLALYFYKEHVF